MVEKKVTHLKLTEKEYKYIKYKSKNFHTIKNLFIVNKNLEMLIITLGSKGSKVYLKNGLLLSYETNKRKKIVNTVGAGDVFSSLIIIGLIKNQNIIDSYYNAIKQSTFSVSKIKCF